MVRSPRLTSRLGGDVVSPKRGHAHGKRLITGKLLETRGKKKE